jgi:hypothetical protein
MISTRFHAFVPPFVNAFMLQIPFQSRYLFSLMAMLSLLSLVTVDAASGQSKLPNLTQLWIPIELTGEVVDSWCYASRSVGDGRGPEHAQCARACAHGGVTLGILDDKGKMYIAAKYRAYSGCQLLLEPYVAKRVHVRGMLATRGGCPILKITSVQELGPGDKPLPSANAPNAKSIGAKYDPKSQIKQMPAGQKSGSKWVTPATAK